jgi:hypothetical protein
MPLPAALQARLAKRGLIKTSEAENGKLELVSEKKTRLKEHPKLDAIHT